MNKNLKHLVTTGIVLSMCLTVLSGCSSKTNTASSSDSKKATSGEAKKPEKIKAFLDTLIEKEDGQDKFAEEYKKQTGIELDITKPAHNEYYDKLNLAFSSGDIPDVVEISGQYMVKYATQKGLVQLDDYVKKSEILAKVDSKVVDSERIDGKLFGYPVGGSTAPVTYVRKDWLDNLGLKIPTTYDEFHEMLKAFVEQDPDKNGKKDTIGYTAAGVTDPKFTREFWLDAKPDFVLKDGKYVDGFSEANFKPALQRFVDAYKEGLIDKEVITNKSSTCRDKFNSGTVGVFQYWNSTWAKTLDESLKNGPAGKNATAMPIPPLKNGYYISRVPGTVAITTKAKDPEGIFKYFIEYMHDGGKGQVLFSHGVEGVHWEMKDGKIIHKPSMRDPKTIFNKVFASIEDSLLPYSSAFPYDIDSRIPQSIKVMGDNYISDITLPASKTLTKANADLTALRGEIIAKAILGQMTVDEAISKYNKDAKALGMDEIIKEINSKN